MDYLQKIMIIATMNNNTPQLLPQPDTPLLSDTQVFSAHDESQSLLK